VAQAKANYVPSDEVKERRLQHARDVYREKRNARLTDQSSRAPANGSTVARTHASASTADGGEEVRHVDRSTQRVAEAPPRRAHSLDAAPPGACCEFCGSRGMVLLLETRRVPR
jgi:hypothetical protein